MNLLQSIKWKLFMWKIQISLVRYDIRDKFLRRKYCRYGIHKIISESVGYGGSRQRMKYVRFLRCVFCNYKFFAKKSDKERYMKHEGLTKGALSALLKHSSTTKPKRL